MPKRQLDNLVAAGVLKSESPTASEIEGLIRSGNARLDDAEKESLSIESRFDLAYNAAHALSLAALRWHGYRSDKRYVVFQALAHTLALPPPNGVFLRARIGCGTRSNTKGPPPSTNNCSPPFCASRAKSRHS